MGKEFTWGILKRRNTKGLWGYKEILKLVGNQNIFKIKQKENTSLYLFDWQDLQSWIKPSVEGSGEKDTHSTVGGSVDWSCHCGGQAD